MKTRKNSKENRWNRRDCELSNKIPRRGVAAKRRSPHIVPANHATLLTWGPSVSDYGVARVKNAIPYTNLPMLDYHWIRQPAEGRLLIFCSLYLDSSRHWNDPTG